MKPADDIPYRRTYGRILVVLVLAAVPIAALLPNSATGIAMYIRAFVGTYGMGVAMIVGPTLAYSGLRTCNIVDVLFGCAGMLTLIYWIPCVLLR